MTRRLDGIREVLIPTSLVIAVLAGSLAWIAVKAPGDDETHLVEYDPRYASPQLEALIGVENYRTRFVHDHEPITCTDLPYCSEIYFHRFDPQLERFVDETEAADMRASLVVPTPTAKRRCGLPDTLSEAAAEMWIKENGCSIPDQGPVTLGSFVQIDGQEIKLPDDAWVVAKVQAPGCNRDNICATAPLWKPARGDQEVSIDGAGWLWSYDRSGIDSPEFEFLRIAVDVKELPQRDAAQ